MNKEEFRDYLINSELTFSYKGKIIYVEEEINDFCVYDCDTEEEWLYKTFDEMWENFTLFGIKLKDFAKDITW